MVYLNPGDPAPNLLLSSADRRYLPEVEAHVWVLKVRVLDIDHALDVVFANLGVVLLVVNKELEDFFRGCFDLQDDPLNHFYRPRFGVLVLTAADRGQKRDRVVGLQHCVKRCLLVVDGDEYALLVQGKLGIQAPDVFQNIGHSRRVRYRHIYAVGFS
jgi:hypothetical protein